MSSRTCPPTCKAACDAIRFGDVRLFRDSQGRICCHDAYISGIYHVQVLPTSIQAQPLATRLCFDTRAYDKNWALVASDPRGKWWDFLNWFTPDGHVTMTRVHNDEPHKCATRNVLTMAKDRIPPLGSSQAGMFSLGTPFAPLSASPTSYSYDALAVGHVKVLATYQYQNPSIHRFLAELDQAMVHWGDRRAEHTSYHYLMYFMHLTRPTPTARYKLHISDAFLLLPDAVPRSEAAQQPWVSNINFPMSVSVLGARETALVSMGVGDFYTATLALPLEEALAMCRHDVEYMDLSDYRYQVLVPPTQWQVAAATSSSSSSSASPPPYKKKKTNSGRR